MAIRVPGGSEQGRGASGTMRSVTLPPEAEAAALRKEAHALKKAKALTDRGYRMVDLGRMEKAGRGYVVHVDSRELFRHEPGEPPAGRPTTHVFGITDSHELRWYSPAETTIDQVLEREKRGHEESTEAHERERKARAATARPLVWADVYGDASTPPTLRAVGEALHNLGGNIRIEEGRVVVALPPGEIGQGQPGVRLANYVYSGEQAVIEAVKGKAGMVPASKLPDRALLPSGKLAP